MPRNTRNVVVAPEVKTSEAVTESVIEHAAKVINYSEKVVEKTKGIITEMSKKNGGKLASHSEIQACDVHEVVENMRKQDMSDFSIASLLTSLQDFLSLGFTEEVRKVEIGGKIVEKTFFTSEVRQGGLIEKCIDRKLESGKKGKIFILSRKEGPSEKRFLAYHSFMDFQNAVHKMKQAKKNAENVF